jgi:hypothetical protein
MLMSVAFVVCQLRVDDCPLSIVSGLAASEAVGAAGGGGGGGGGGGCFLWQAPRNKIAPSAITRTEHLNVSCFNFLLPILSAKHARLILVGIDLLPEISRTHVQLQQQNYFQLQSGSELLPDEVSCCGLLPSANMLQICNEPDRLD